MPEREERRPSLLQCRLQHEPLPLPPPDTHLRALLADEPQNFVLPLPRLARVAEDDLRPAMPRTVAAGCCTVEAAMPQQARAQGRLASAAAPHASKPRQTRLCIGSQATPLLPSHRSSTPAPPTARCRHSGSQASFCSRNRRRWALSRAMKPVPAWSGAGWASREWVEGAAGGEPVGLHELGASTGLPNRRRAGWPILHRPAPSSSAGTNPLRPPTRRDHVAVKRGQLQFGDGGLAIGAQLCSHLAPHLHEREGGGTLGSSG